MKRLLLLAAFFLVPGTAIATLCADLGPAGARRTNLIFRGRVLSVRDTFVAASPPVAASRDTNLKSLPIERGSRWRTLTKFRVDELWNGSPSAEVTLLATRDVRSMIPGDVVLVYADSTEAGYTLGVCSRIRYGKGAREDSVALGPPVYVRADTVLRRAR